jgi:hypothetical protein
MQKITSSEGIRRAIVELEHRQIVDEALFREQFFITYESLKPINVLRNTLYELITPSRLKDNLVQTGMGIISGYISRKILVRSSSNAFLRLSGIILQYGVTNFVSNNSAAIKKVIIQFADQLAGHYRMYKNQ